MRQELTELSGTIDRTLRNAGVKISEREEHGMQVCRVFIPLSPRPLIVTARVALPGEVGRLFKGKFAAKARAVAKKVVKSKVLKKIAKVIGPIAAVVPGMQGIAMGIAAAAAAKKIVSAAKKNPRAKKFAANAIRKLNTGLKSSRSYRVSRGGSSTNISI